MLLIFFTASKLNNKNEQEIRTRKFGQNSRRERTTLENLTRDLMICTRHQILFGWSNREELVWGGM
jgi:hypothetical protein